MGNFTPVLLHLRSVDTDNGDFTYTKERSYKIPRHGTLAGADLERGDTLPEDATFEIIQSSLGIEDDPKDGLIGVIRVVSNAYTTEQTTGDCWREWRGTRTVHDVRHGGEHFIVYQIRFIGVVGTNSKPEDMLTYGELTGSAELDDPGTGVPRAIEYVYQPFVSVNKHILQVTFRGQYIK